MGAGAPQLRRTGIDRTTIADVEHYGVDPVLDELDAELREGRYRPIPARRVYIPKPGRAEQRPLSIPAVRDRVVQAALKIVIEPVFEADMLPCSFGFRPKRSAHDALQVLLDESLRGKRWVVETDIADCFTAIPHEGLMQRSRSASATARSSRCCGRFARRGDGGRNGPAPVSGTPQGGVVSPLLCNVYLNRLDRAWRPGRGVLVRYADDLVVMCRYPPGGRARPRAAHDLLADLGLEPKPEKTRIVHLVERRGVRLPRLPPPLGAGTLTARSTGVFLARWPSDKAMQRVRGRLRELTPRRCAGCRWKCRGGPQQVLRGWADYFRIWELGPALQQGAEPCVGTPGAPGGQTPPPLAALWLVGRCLSSRPTAWVSSTCQGSLGLMA